MAELVVLDKAKVLPNGYTELEYIQSNDYHPTIEVNSIKNIAENEIEFQTQIMWVGSSVNNGGTLEIGFGSSSYNAIRTFGVTYEGYWKTNQTKITPNKRASTNVLYDISYKMYSNKVILEVKNGDTTEVNSTVNYNIPFDGNSVFYPTDYMGYGLRSARIYFSKVYRDGVLVFNGIPAKRNSDNAVGLYDTISNTFHKQIASQSSSAFNFIAGPEILPEYSSVIPVIYLGTSDLPHSNKKYDLYDRVKTDTIVYTELEYLELQGEAYFNANVYLSKDMDIEFETMLIQMGNAGRFGGARKISNEGGFLFVYNYQNSGINNVIADFFGRNATGSTPNTSRWIVQNSGSDYVPETNKKYKLSIINKVGSFSVDGVSISTHTYVGNGESPNDVPLYIGATNNVGTVYTNESNINWRFYHFSATGVADIVPVRRNSDNVLGLYNKTTGEFLQKIGNGTLVAGPVVSTITSESKDIGIVVGFQLDQEDNEYAVVCLNAEYRLEEDEILSKSGDYGTTKYSNQTVWETKETGTYTTQKILDFLASTTGVNGKYTSKSATYFRTLSFSIDNQLYYGQIPNLPEISNIYSRKDKINKEDPSASTHSNLLLPKGNEIKGFGNNALLNSCTQYDSRDIYIIRIHGTVGAIYRDLTRGCIGVPILELPNPEL